MKFVNFQMLLVLLFLTTQNTQSGFERVNINSRVNGKALTGIASQRNFCKELNPATLIKIPTKISFSHTPSEFGMSELTTNLFSVDYFTDDIAIGFSAEKFGFELYSENNYRISVSKLIDEYLSVGVLLNSNRLQYLNYGTVTEYSIDVGLVFKISENVNAAVVATNINIEFLNKLKNELPQTATWGLNYEFSDDGEICVDVTKDVDTPFELNVGMEYSIHKNIILLSGVNSSRSIFSGGIIFNYQNFEFGYSLSQHAILGDRTIFTVSYNFGR